MPMRTEPLGISVDVVRADVSRFRHPLLLLHGLWTGGWIWRDFSAYLAHRGWDAWAPSFLEGEEVPDLERRRRTLIAVCRELPAPPVVVTHDAGIAVADLLATEVALPAIVAVAPFVPRPSIVWHRPRWWGARFGARPLAPPGTGGDPLIRGLRESEVHRLRADSPSLLRESKSGAPGGDRPAIPGMVVAVDADLAAPLADCRRLATRRRWDLAVQADGGGHFPMLGGTTIRLADRVHRWLVRALGADLLAWVENEDGGD